MAAPLHFAIIGVDKLKSRAEIVGRASHHLRAHQVPNADPELARHNQATFHGTPAELADRVQDRVGELVKRKDAVRAIEVMLTASPEWFKQHGGTGDTAELTKRAVKWLVSTFGKANVVAAGVHMDERTPHIWAIVTPITKDGRLSASEWLDGPKKLAALHTTWAAATKDLGLSRGTERSLAKRVDVRTFYAAANGSVMAAQHLEREMTRRARAAKERAEEAESRAALAEQRATSIAQREKALDVERRRVQALFEAMTPDQQETAAKRYDAKTGVSTPPKVPERVVGRSTGPAKPQKPLTP